MMQEVLCSEAEFKVLHKIYPVQNTQTISALHWAKIQYQAGGENSTWYCFQTRYTMSFFLFHRGVRLCVQST